MKPPEPATHWVAISLDAEVIVHLPIFLRHKHFTAEETEDVLKCLADNLGGTFLYTSEIES